MGAIFTLLFVPICICDLHQRLIPNIYLKVLGGIMLLTFILRGFPSAFQFITLIALAIVLIGLRVGMGDIKLISIIVLSFDVQPFVFFSLCALIGMVHSGIASIRFRGLPHTIPLAPSIFIAFLTYLATRQAGYLPQYAHALVNSW